MTRHESKTAIENSVERRSFLKQTISGTLSATVLLNTIETMARTEAASSSASASPAINLQTTSKSPVLIKSIELLRYDKYDLVRTTSTDGATGISITNGRPYLHPLFKEIIVPFFIGKDARDLEQLVDGVYRHASNYKLAGLAFWNCVGWLDVSLMDMMGRIAGKSIAEMLGGMRRRNVPVYMSSLTRETTPEEEVKQLSQRLAETGARGVKIKVGGRIGRPEPIAGRTEKLIPLARKVLGDDITIYADANGSYDARRGIEVGKLLEEHNVAIYEEPCPFEEYEDTKRVADALTRIKVAGGEQDSSLPRWRWIIRERMLDVVQPDIYYNGGLLRTAAVARMAAERGIGIAPHNPKIGAEEAHLLQFVASVPNLEGLQEYNGRAKAPESWYSPQLIVKNGALEVPTGPGLGITIDPEVLRKAKQL